MPFLPWKPNGEARPAKARNRQKSCMTAGASSFSGGYRTEAPPDQPRACARGLSKYLHGKTGEPVHVTPVVTLPGWYVKPLPGAENAEVKVVNPGRAWTLLDNSGTQIAWQQATASLTRSPSGTRKQIRALPTLRAKTGLHFTSIPSSQTVRCLRNRT